MKVYPRVCGGTCESFNGQVARWGLSPRVRGNLVQGDAVVDGAGSIPACAGEPRRQATAGALDRVYPRVCGGTGTSAAPHRSCPGLSPRVRGNHRRLYRPVMGVRSIPACAGEPSTEPLRDASKRVYPRVCGGTLRRTTTDSVRRGLSPRVRGNLSLSAGGAGVSRSIPACAGEPPSALRRSRTKEVYPRVCGGTRLPYR